MGTHNKNKHNKIQQCSESPKTGIPNEDPKWAPVTGIRNGNPKRLTPLRCRLGFWNGNPTRQFQISRATGTHDLIGPLDHWTLRPLDPNTAGQPARLQYKNKKQLRAARLQKDNKNRIKLA